MDTTPLENSDVQNLFRNLNLSQTSSSHPTPSSYISSGHPFHNFPPSSFQQAESYNTLTNTLSSSYSEVSDGPVLQQHPSFSQDHLFPHHNTSSQVLPSSSPLPDPTSILLHTNRSSRPSSPTLDSARLMALLSGELTSGLETSASLELPSSSVHSFSSETACPAVFVPALPSAPPMSLAPVSSHGRLANNVLPRGRSLKGEHVVYNVDARVTGEIPAQLEVNPITMYTSQNILLNGRQIAVNRNYICYGLRPKRHIRILNINTPALRSLLRGHSERVTDMAFFAEDVHVLASASSDGKVFVRKVLEGPDEDGELQIRDEILLALQFTGDWDSVHPRICWLSDTQDVLMVGISKYVFTVDIPTVRNSAAPDGFDMEEPVCCSVKEVIEGVCCIIEHDGDIADIATSQCGLSVSASKDGTIRLWKDHNSSSLIPHRGQEVCAVALLSASHHPDHIILLSAGPLNRELRLWVPLTKEGWLPPSGQCNWKCIQTLELTSSGGNVEDEFFNQVLVVPRSNIILLANAKKSALYVVHVDFGSSPADTRLDYLTEFSVMLPILSFTATSENIANGDRFLQVYCVQTQAIQQYSLDLAQCLPPVGQYASESSLDSRVELSTDMIANRVASYEAESIAADTMGTSSSAGKSFPANQSVPFGSCDMDLVGDSRVIGISTSDTMDSSTREIAVHVSKGSSPAPEVELTARSPRGSPLPKMRVKSLDDFHVSTSRENLDYFSSFEQSGDPNDRPAASSIPSSPKQTIWEPPSSSQRIHINNPVRMNEGKEWQPSSGMPSVSEAQSNAGSSMHLITPSELMSMVTRTKIDVEEGPLRAPSGMDILKELMKPVSGSEASVAKGDFESLTIETKEMNETAKFLPDDVGPKKVVLLRRGVPGLDPRMRIFHAPIMDNTTGTSLSESAHRMQDVDSIMGEESVREDDQAASEEKEPLHTAPGDENIEQFHEASALVDGIQMLSVVPQTRRKKSKNKTDINVLMNPIISSSATMSNVTSISEQDSSRISSGVLPSKLSTQIIEMQDAVNQLLAMQRDFQKQLQLMQAVPVAKELKRVEVVIGQRMEKVLKAHMDALWARLQEDFSKCEKVEREQMQHLSSFLSNYLNKDLVSALERALKKELSTIGSSVARLVAPNVDKSITMAVTEAFQKGINEKGVIQIEKSIGANIEASMSRQLHSQFQTTGKVALQEALRSSLEVSVIPAFERSCQSMFAQVDAAFQNGLFDTQAQAQQLLASSGITSALQEAVTSATSLAASLKGELADGHRRLLAVIEGTGVSHGPYTVNGALPDKVMTVQHVEESLDPTKELTRLLAERKYEEAFDKALSLTDVGVVSWLCNQVDLQAILTTTPLPLSQGVLLALIQQLGFDLRNDTGKKLGWIKDAALALNPMDPGLPPHVMRHILEKLYNNLHGLLTTSISADLMFSTRLMIHVVNSLLTACK